MARSEELTRVVGEAWERSTSRTARSRGPVHVSVDDRTLADVVRRMDELSRAWAAVPVGEGLTLTWPDRLTVRMGGTRRGRRPMREAGRRR